MDIDVQIMTGEGEGQRKAHHLIVENKVKASSAQRTQLADEFACVSAAIREADPAPITVVFLTPPGESGALRDEFGTLELDGQDAHRKAWMRWRAPAAEHQQTIVDLIRELLRREAIAEIEPITDYIRHTLKAFVLFLQREIVSESAEKRRLPSLDATDATDQRIVELDSERYLIVRYGDETVKVFDVEEDQEVDAHPKLRRTNEAYGLDVPLTYASQRIKNTRVLGKQILKALWERNLGIVPDVARGQGTA
ncbi:MULTISPECIES: hypothetical protein [Paraburkholderia]|uniref:hypothetical protein n=1 Tax=Paraburkholderia TaxID=1822464 RepID=UPI002AB647B7|nr:MULTISPECIES: hypothetical protein [Paraburkholderia]